LKTVKDIMKKPIMVEKTAKISEVLRKLLEKNISRVLVEGNNGPVGIVTERDIGFFLLAEQTERKIDEIQVSEIMKPLITVNHVASVEDGAQIMIDKNISSLGVNVNNRTEGIFTKTDLTQYYTQNFVGKKRVGDVMTISFVSASESEPLYEVVPTLFREKVSRVIIKNDKDSPVGVLSFRDLFRLSLTLGKEEEIIDNASGISVLFSRKGFLSKTGFGATILAKEAMTRGIITVEHDDDLVTACIALIENNINGVGVTVNNKLTGIVSKTDITRAIIAIAKESKDTV
jgi:CBS domain-containing protein